MFVYVCCIQLKMCVGYTELGNRVRPTARGCHEDIPAAHGGEKKKCWLLQYFGNMGPV